jgi:hypothetical protein
LFGEAAALRPAGGAGRPSPFLLSRQQCRGRLAAASAAADDPDQAAMRNWMIDAPRISTSRAASRMAIEGLIPPL